MKYWWIFKLLNHWGLLGIAHVLSHFISKMDACCEGVQDIITKH